MGISIEFGDEGEKKHRVREEKGKSLIDFPLSYVVIDIETTGFDPQYDSIIEVSAVRYENENKIESFSELIRPGSYYYLDEEDLEKELDYCIVDGAPIQYIDQYISKLTGITNKMLENARAEADVLQDLRNFIKNDILIGHNVNFDVNFLYDAYMTHFNTPLKNDFIDTMRLGRRLSRDLKHHRLEDLAKYYNISYEGAHRALADCLITYKVFQAIKSDILTQYDSIESFVKLFNRCGGGKSLSIKDIIATKTEFNEVHPLFGKVCVFTGTLDRMVRKDAMQLVVDLGGINGNSITAKTNYLILGNNDYCTQIKDGKSNKQKKSEELRLKGHDISIITENVFYDILETDW